MIKSCLSHAVVVAALFLGSGSLLAAQDIAAASTAERIQSRTYSFEEAGQEMPYELYVPSRYDPATPAPLIVALHGLGFTPEQVIRYQGLTDLAEERGYFVVAPMGYNVRGWYGSRGSGRASTRGDAANDPENIGDLSEQDVLNVLERVRAEFNIDDDRIYLMGHSMGGGGTRHLAIKYPELWDAIAPVAPAIYSTPDALSAITHIPVIVLMGDADPLVDVEVTRAWARKVEELGMRHSYLEIPGGEHSRLIVAHPGNMEKIFDFFDAAQVD